MSCPNATSPIDINLSNISGSCVLKCEYSFNYNSSSCVAINRGDYISLSYDNSSSQNITFNNLSYSVKEIRIYIPSLHSYSSVRTDGEFVIVHSPNNAGNQLLVCIPIKLSGVTNIGSALLGSIINTVADKAPSSGETTTVSIPNYNLNSIVPLKPFFSYSATIPYQPCTENADFVVFGLDYSMDISIDALTRLKSIISVNVYDIKTNTLFFYNEKGPGNNVSGDDIYIDCFQVGESEETEAVVTASPPSNDVVNIMMNNQIFKLILGSLFILLILYIISIIFSFAKSGGGMEGGGRIIR
jgi:carbonic anhydrase